MPSGASGKIFSFYGQGPAPHREDPQIRRRTEQFGHERGARVDEMLEPVDDEQELALPEMVEEDLALRAARVVGQFEGRGERVLDQLRLAHRGEVHPPDGVAAQVPRGQGGRSRGEAGLADSAGTGHGDQASRLESPRELREFVGPTDEAVELEGEVAGRGGTLGPVGRAQFASHQVRSVLSRKRSVQSVRATPPAASGNPVRSADPGAIGSGDDFSMFRKRC